MVVDSDMDIIYNTLMQTIKDLGYADLSTVDKSTQEYIEKYIFSYIHHYLMVNNINIDTVSTNTLDQLIKIALSNVLEQLGKYADIDGNIKNYYIMQ